MKYINIKNLVGSNGLTNNSWLAKSLILGLFGLTLTACGGGSSGDDAAAATPPPPGTPQVAISAAGGTAVTFSWVNPSGVSGVTIQRRTGATSAAAGTASREPAFTVTEDSLLAPGRVTTTIEAIDLMGIEDGQYHIFNITQEIEGGADRSILNARPIQLNFPAITGVTAVPNEAGTEVTLSWTNPARVASVAVAANRYDSTSADATSTPTDITNPVAPSAEGSQTVTIDASTLVAGNYTFSVAPTFASDSGNKVGTAVTATAADRIELVGSGGGVDPIEPPPTTIPGGGDVDVDDDGLIEISSAAEFNMTRNNLEGTGLTTTAGATTNSSGCPATGCNGYELTANIDLSELGSSWTPIGGECESSFCNEGKLFTGTFNGNGYEITGFNITTDAALLGVGLFGAVSETALLTNIHIRGYGINASNSAIAGAIAGYAEGATVLFSSAEISKVVAKSRVGGLIGNGTSIRMLASYARVADIVTTNRRTSFGTGAGGLVAIGSEAIVNASFAVTTGRIDANSISDRTIVGGLVGDWYSLPQALRSSTAPTVINSHWDNKTVFPDAQPLPESLARGNSTAELQNGELGADYIYTNWNSIFCNPMTGAFSFTAGEAGFQPAWAKEAGAYPTLNCLNTNN